MSKSKKFDYYEYFDLETQKEVIFFNFDFKQKILKLDENKNYDLRFGFNSPIIGNCAKSGDDLVITINNKLHILGRGEGKEVWTVSVNENEGYNINIKKYTYNQYGSALTNLSNEENIVWTKSELDAFQAEKNVKVVQGENVFYTSWAVLPDPVIHYSTEDTTYMGSSVGTIIISDYFKGNLNLSVEGESVSDYILNMDEMPEYFFVPKSKKNKYIGISLSEEAYSSQNDEFFDLGKGSDVIRFKSNDEFYMLPHRFGNDIVKLSKGEKLTLDMENLATNLTYARDKNDLIISSYYHIAIAGRSFGKELWIIEKNRDSSYKVVKTEYYFTGSGYKKFGEVTEQSLSNDDISNFEKNNGIKLKCGVNTLYTSWAVVQNPIKHYSLTDSANYGSLLGKVRLKDYFKINEDNVFIGETSVREILKDNEDILNIDKSRLSKKQNIKDTFLDEFIIGSKKSDRISSLYGDDVIEGGKGNDKITLGEGDKTVNINQGDGKDTLVILSNNTSANIVFDDTLSKMFFTKSGKNLIINREYTESQKVERTIIKNFYSQNSNSIKISAGNSVIIDELNQETVNWLYQISSNYSPVDSGVSASCQELPSLSAQLGYVVDDNFNYML